MSVLYIDYAQAKQSPDAFLFATYRRWFALGIGVTLVLMLVAR